MNLTHEDAKKDKWLIVKPLDCEVVGKAVYGDGIDQSIMKSTKRFKVEGGWIYNTSTEYHKGDRVSIAEALVFVPSTEGEEKKQKGGKK